MVRTVAGEVEVRIVDAFDQAGEGRHRAQIERVGDPEAQVPDIESQASLHVAQVDAEMPEPPNPEWSLQKHALHVIPNAIGSHHSGHSRPLLSRRRSDPINTLCLI
jgi:hypothetical protein